jgi:hypothetical protein
MEKEALKSLLYGGMMELINDKNYFYHSTISANYSKLTDAGVEALTKYITAMAELMIESETKELDQRAKDMVLKGLKGETV